MFVVNRQELITQSMSKFDKLQGKYSVIKAGANFKHLFDGNKPCQLVMIQSWNAKKDKFDNLEPKYILVDEIHDGWSAGRMKNLKEAYPQAKIIGLSATPIDDKGNRLKGIDKFIETATIKQLQTWINPANGLPFLADDSQHYIPDITDFSHIKIKGSDYDPEELAEEINKNFHISNIVDFWEKKAKYKKTLCFCVNKKHAEKVHQAFKDKGYRCAIIHCDLKDETRTRILQLHKDGKIDVLVNVGILTTGYDDPSLECIILAFPTKTLRKYIQMLGRGGRTQPGKTSFIILDFGNNGLIHGRWSDDRYYTDGKDKYIKDFEPFICPECFTVITEKMNNCPICDEPLYDRPEYKANDKREKEAIEIKKLVLLKQEEYSEKTTIDMLSELINKKEEARDIMAFWEYGIKKLKPNTWDDSKFNKLAQMAIKHNTKSFKPVSSILKYIKNKTA